MSFSVVAVGSEFPWMNQINKNEGTSLNYDSDESLFMTINWRNISSKEKREINNGIIRFRYVQEGEYIILLMKIGIMPPMEFPFDPTKCVRNGRSFGVTSNFLPIFAIENTNYKLVAMRSLGLSQDFLNHFNCAWKNNIRSKSFSYSQWLNKLRSSHSINKLWEKGTKINWK